MKQTIPHNFIPRKYQLKFLAAVRAAMKGESKKRYFYQIWHRRAGKDRTNIAGTIPSRLIQDPCLVKLAYPTLVMARENMWDGIGGDGFRYVEHIPDFIRVGNANETRMTIPVRNKVYDEKSRNYSLFQLAGTNKPDSLRGGNPKMMVFSEWAECDPYALDVVEPIFKENDGIIIFNTTPKGDNHAKTLLEYAKHNEKYWVQILTAEDTGIWTFKELDEIREDIVRRFAANGRSQAEAEAYFLQEYMCSFDTPVVGSYYGDQMRLAEKQNRITVVPWLEDFPVHTFWDLGMDDSMSIWFMQEIAQQFRFIDYYESSGEGLSHYAKVLQDKGYVYGQHFAPHDISVRELGTGKSRLEVAARLGIKFETAPKLDIDDGINACRAALRRCWFDEKKCYRGINCLKNYKKEWDEKNKVFRAHPKHDWSSHGADSFRTFGVGYRRKIIPKQQTSFGGVKPYIEGLG